MAEYIDKETAIVKAVKCIDNSDPLAHDIKEAIKAIPPADVVKRKHGKWETAYLDQIYAGCRPRAVYCSNCHIVSAFKTPFCPNCGADMRESEGEDG